MTFPSPLGPASNPWRRGEVTPSPSCCRQPCHQKRLPVMGRPPFSQTPPGNKTSRSLRSPRLSPTCSFPVSEPGPPVTFGDTRPQLGFGSLCPEVSVHGSPRLRAASPAREGGGAAAVPGSPRPPFPVRGRTEEPLRETPRSPAPGAGEGGTLGGVSPSARLPRGCPRRGAPG